jgi:transcriptional regulator with XRE-family HTH domain
VSAKSGAVADAAAAGPSTLRSVAGDTLGSRLRALRNERRYSLADVAKGTGLSASFLSLVENDRSDITISRLMRVVDFYGIRMSELIEEVPHVDSMVVRKNEHRHLYSRAEGIDVHLLAPTDQTAMTPVLTIYEPRGEWADFKGAPGTELFIHVLAGRLELDVEGHEPAVLRTGDSAYFRADRPHRLRNPGKSVMRMIGVVTPPAW